MTQTLNEKRRELVQTLLVVGGIVGGIMGIASPTVPPAPVSSSFVLGVLVVFIFIAVLVYALLMTEDKSFGTSYNFAAFGVSFLFVAMMFEIMLNAQVNLTEAIVLSAIGMPILMVTLIRDWDKKKTTPSEAGRATTP
ncbi:MAG TPA: hypothetical protein VND41_00720 [Nitrososphaerales archaeon]|nr:hypothetical protein [Nitrososphaerales archaeon]